MVRRGARGDGFLHGEAPSERPAFRGCRGGRRDRYRISNHRCMFCVNGHGGYTHCGDVPDYASSNDDSHDEASSSSDDFGVITSPYYSDLWHFFWHFVCFSFSCGILRVHP